MLTLLPVWQRNPEDGWGTPGLKPVPPSSGPWTSSIGITQGPTWITQVRAHPKDAHRRGAGEGGLGIPLTASAAQGPGVKLRPPGVAGPDGASVLPVGLCFQRLEGA